jgi:hypothetical protein
MKILSICSGGESHFEDVEIPLEDLGHAGKLWKLQSAAGVVFPPTEGDYKYDRITQGQSIFYPAIYQATARPSGLVPRSLMSPFRRAEQLYLFLQNAHGHSRLSGGVRSVYSLGIRRNRSR